MVGAAGRLRDLRLRPRAAAASRRRRACARSPPRSATRSRSASRSPRRSTAKPASRLHVTLVSLHALILLTVLTALVELDLARAERRSDARRRRSCSRTLATTVRNTVDPSGDPAGAGRPGLESSGCAMPGFVDEILATLGQAVVPLCLVLIGVSLAHYGVKGALRGAAVLCVRQARRPAARGARCSPASRSASPACRSAIVVMMAALPVGSNALDLLPALPDPAGGGEHGDRRLDPGFRRDRATLDRGAARDRLTSPRRNIGAGEGLWRYSRGAVRRRA